MPSSSLLTCLFLFALVAATQAAPAACQIPGSTCAFSPDINTWSRAPGLNGTHQRRFWDRAALNAALTGPLSARSNLFHVRNFFDKLASGKRIVSVALGSSLVHDFAGCWQPSFKQLWEEGCIPSECCQRMHPCSVHLWH